MKKITSPNIDWITSFDTCVSGVIDADLKARLQACGPALEAQACDYVNRAHAEALFMIPPLKCGPREDPIVVGGLHKSELMDLYSYYMLDKKPARYIYDRIKAAANDKCPFCGDIGHPKTLDHYLPKANYSQFSVLPLNLVPSCRDCNLPKNNTLAEVADDQILHPYFDPDYYFNEKWVFARVIKTTPCSLEYYVEPPTQWSAVSKNRVRKHFDNLDLANRYSIEAGKELGTLIDQRKGLMASFPPTVFQEHLLSIGNSSTLFLNHWRRVMYTALSEDDWFLEYDFRLT